jgi:hypothetical protein
MIKITYLTWHMVITPHVVGGRSGAVTSCPDKGARSSTDRRCRSILRLLQNRGIEHRRAAPRRSLRCSNGHHHRARGSSEREPAGHAFPSTRPRRAVRVGAAGMDRWGPGADAIIPIRASLSPPPAPGPPVVLLRGWAHKVARGDDGDAIGAALFPRRRVVMRPGRLAAWSVRASTSKPGLPSLLPSRAPPRSVGRPPGPDICLRAATATAHPPAPGPCLLAGSDG